MEGVERQVLLPGRERHTLHQRRQGRDRFRLPDDEFLLLVEARCREERIPVEPRRALRELGARPVVVALDHVFRFSAAGVGFGETALELEDARCFRLGIRDSPELQHRGDVREVSGANVRHARRRVEVVVAIGHGKPALQEERRILRRVVEILRDPEPEDVVGVELRVVEHVHVRAHGPAEVARERLCAVDPRDCVELRLERGKVLRLDARLVHEAVVVVADLACVGPFGRVDLGCFGDQGSGLLRSQLGEDSAGSPGATVGGNFGRLEPGAVGVGEEVVARSDGEIHARQIQAHRLSRSCDLRRGSGRHRRGLRRRTGEGKQESDRETLHGGAG